MINFNNGPEGNIYTEVIKYSTLLERARFRNQIFIDKLLNGDSEWLNLNNIAVPKIQDFLYLFLCLLEYKDMNLVKYR